MIFKKTAQTAAMVATVCGVSTVVFASSANAAQLSGSIKFETIGNFNLSDTLIDFDGAEVQEATGSFTPLVNTEVDIQDIVLTSPTTVLGAVTPFIDFGTVSLEGENRPLVFDLTSATIETVVDTNVITVLLSQDIEGVFRFGDDSIASGLLTAQSFAGSNGSTDGFTLNLSTQPIPTPALLPGLLTLGLGILRKRDQQSTLTEGD